MEPPVLPDGGFEAAREARALALEVSDMRARRCGRACGRGGRSSSLARRDKIVTIFCKPVTCFCEDATHRSPAVVTSVSGRGESVGTGRMDWRTVNRCRRCAVFRSRALVLGLLLCAASPSAGCRERRDVPDVTERSTLPVSRLAEELIGEARPVHAGWAEQYYEGYLAETLRGDQNDARSSYARVIAEAGGEAPELAARAALRLGDLEALAGRRREALELMARASVLGRDNLDIIEQADRLRARLGSLRAGGQEVRGPPLDTPLASVSAEASERFAHAETLLAAYLRIRLKPRLEQLRAGVRKKEYATDAAVRAYKQVVSLYQSNERGGERAGDESTAVIAAEFRIASLYHDLALSLMFDLPPELEPRAAAKLSRSLRSSALGYLNKARAAYQRSLAVDNAGERAAVSERWTAAAALGLRSVEDMLGGSD